jgi:hypothetical protein
MSEFYRSFEILYFLNFSKYTVAMIKFISESTDTKADSDSGTIILALVAPDYGCISMCDFVPLKAGCSNVVFSLR